MDTLSDQLLIKAYNDSKINHLNTDFIQLLEEEILRRIVQKMIAESNTCDMSTIQSFPDDSNIVNHYFNLVWSFSSFIRIFY